ncbi:MAG: potassium channel family protein [Candidatus Promineifilaceae bacterium]|nr:potassium channel family protein [Candidatus Promineifilaceae bacterium]
MNNETKRHRNELLEGKIIYFLVMTVLVQFLYPISVSDSPLVLILYQIFYMSFFAAGIYLVSSNRRVMWLLAAATVGWLIVGPIYAFRPDLLWANFIGYLLIIFFQLALTMILIRFIFRARVVNRDVLLAAITVYLLLGAIFVPVYGIIETLTWFPEQTTHAFVDGLNNYENVPFPWQNFVYYSYATLTTLGYGDILPSTFWARSIATFEAVVGVLYTAVIVARLIGLYAARDVEKDIANQTTARSAAEPAQK